jgi:hypothetical protein
VDRTGQNTFAVFASPDDGYDAAMDRMGEISRQYPSRHGQPAGSLANIAYVWSPPENKNDTESMIRDITRATGLDRNAQWSSLTEAQKLAWLHAYAQREGYRPLASQP